MSFVNTRLTLFALLSAVEEDLRNLLIAHLAEQLTAADILHDQLFDKCQRRLLEDSEAVQPGVPTIHQLIPYSDLGDLFSVMNAHRALLPAPIAESLVQISPQLEKLIPIRNRVCHIRPLTFEDMPFTFDVVNEFSKTTYMPWNELRKTLSRLAEEPHYVLGLEIPMSDAGSQKHNLPSPDFDETGFLGRQKEVDQLLKLCLGPYPVITIVGEGGIGKTALSIKVAYDLLDLPSSPFDAIVWCSSKTMQLTPHEIVRIRDAISNSLGVLQHVAEYLAGAQTTAPIDDLLEYLREFKVLVLLDNLETVLDERLREFLGMLPSGSKVLIYLTR